MESMTYARIMITCTEYGGRKVDYHNVKAIHYCNPNNESYEAQSHSMQGAAACRELDRSSRYCVPSYGMLTARAEPFEQIHKPDNCLLAIDTLRFRTTLPRIYATKRRCNIKMNFP
ncbi:predicted protein [Sclerotinia sclerotiorum 1980 UF-70]|uniref:Uncharacterized protein n=1 Tax=Sclerotinia sclerotiorum (strain ATCC 18683 / 1980 / Ss-1) TaxID=665079 RepID=A7F2P1_SCLS1|nr:predicted protein [Sclerotinia sclerotiorum 1980 UF-70]EDN95983.1 predicted protein [Sclerotinia sclerotiorum 1980 UF-70]